MRIRTSIFAITAVGLFIAGMQGCASEVTVPDEEDTGTGPVTPTTDASKPDTNTPKPDTGTTDTGTPDTSVPDTSVPDAAEAGVDSGPGPRPGEAFDPLAPKPGDPCPAGVNLNDVIDRRCGKCGNQKALCIAGAGGAKVVDTYGACTGEKTGAGACLPRERIVSECGFCGTQTKDCDLSCAYVEGACTGQVAGGCTANEVTYIEGVCADPAHVRRQVCSAACVKGTPEACAPRPLDEIVISQTPGRTVSGESAVYSTKIGKLNTGACPSTVSSTLTSYQYVRVKNDGAMPATVTIENGTPAGATKPNTVVALYPGPNAPGDRTTCVGSVTDSPESITTVIPAGGSVIFHQSLSSASSSNPRFKTDVTTEYLGATPPTSLAIGPNLNDTVTQLVQFDPAQLTERLPSGACPVTLSSSMVVYKYVQVTNAGATARTVDLSGDDPVDSVLAVYTGTNPPATAAERAACVGSANDTCGAAIPTADSCLTGVSIPAAGHIWVLVQHFFTGASYTSPTRLRVTTKN
ncbi:MAG: hypothetical protein IPQ09_07540 [Myxococcales bacterium]|nr:hypothetical protein [Myxococcales bacterium]